MSVCIQLPNTLENQKAAKLIRDYNDQLEQEIEIRFNDQVTTIFLEGEQIYLPSKKLLPKEAIINGLIKKKEQHLVLQPKEKGKTVNLHLDSELVEELDKIRQYVSNKTQHELILELFKKGIEQYNHEHDQNEQEK